MTWGLSGQRCSVLPILPFTFLGVSSTDGCSLMLPPCFGEQSSQYLDREALASQVRKMEEENQLLKLKLSHSQAQEETLGRMDFPQQFIKEQEGRSNYSGCPKQRMVRKCEVKIKLIIKTSCGLPIHEQRCLPKLGK